MTDAGGKPWAMPEPDALPGSGSMDEEDLTDVATAAEMAGFTAGPPTLEFVTPDDDDGPREDATQNAIWDSDESASVTIETLRVPGSTVEPATSIDDPEIAEERSTTAGSAAEDAAPDDAAPDHETGSAEAASEPTDIATEATTEVTNEATAEATAAESADDDARLEDAAPDGAETDAATEAAAPENRSGLAGFGASTEGAATAEPAEPEEEPVELEEPGSDDPAAAAPAAADPAAGDERRDGPGGDGVDDSDPMSRASALAASWIPRSSPVPTAETTSVFGTRAASPEAAISEVALQQDADEAGDEAPELPHETSPDGPNEGGAAEDGSGLESGQPGEWMAAETDALTEAASVDQQGYELAAESPGETSAGAVSETNEEGSDESADGEGPETLETEPAAIADAEEASADDFGPPESSVREDAEDVPAEDIQVESIESDEDRWWIEPDEADRPDQGDDGEASIPLAVAPEGTSAGPTPDPSFLAELLGRTPESEPDAFAEAYAQPEADTLLEPGFELEMDPGTEPEQAGQAEEMTAAAEPGPVDAIAASFGSWVAPETRREFQPLSAEERSSDAPADDGGSDHQGEVSAWAAWPQPPQPEEADGGDREVWPEAGLSAPSAPAPSATPETPPAETPSTETPTPDAPPADARDGSVLSRYATPAGGIRTLSVLGAEGAAEPGGDALTTMDDASTVLPPDATPEARLRAQLRQRAANASGTSGGPSASGDLWLLTGEPDRAAGAASARSPVLSLVLTGIAVLIVVVIVIGVLYMFGIL